MRKRANRGTGALAVGIMIAAALYLLGQTPGAMGILARVLVGIVAGVFVAAMLIALLEARQSRRR